MEHLNGTDSVLCTRAILESGQNKQLPETIINLLDDRKLTDRLLSRWETASAKTQGLRMQATVTHSGDSFDIRFTSNKRADSFVVENMQKAARKQAAAADDDPELYALQNAKNAEVLQTYSLDELPSHFDECVYEFDLTELGGAVDTFNFGCIFLDIVLRLRENQVLSDSNSEEMVLCEPWLSRRITRHGMSTTRDDTPIIRCSVCNNLSVRSSIALFARSCECKK